MAFYDRSRNYGVPVDQFGNPINPKAPAAPPSGFGEQATPPGYGGNAATNIPGRVSGFRSGAAPGGGGSWFYAPEGTGGFRSTPPINTMAPGELPATQSSLDAQGNPMSHTETGAGAATPITPGSGFRTGALGSSVGGSMVRIVNPNTGVEEIKSTGRPSWQLYAGQGQADQYLGAVGAWKEGLAKEAGATQRANLAAQTQENIANAPAREGPGQAQEREMRGKLFDTQQTGLQQAQDKENRQRNIAGLDTLLHSSPYSTFDAKTGKTQFLPAGKDMAIDKMSAENVAATSNPEAGYKHFEDRQMARKWLTTQPLPHDFDANAYLSAVSSDPKAWSDLMSRAKKAGLPPGPVQPKSPWTEFFGPTKLQGEAGGPQGFRGLTESMGD